MLLSCTHRNRIYCYFKNSFYYAKNKLYESINTYNNVCVNGNKVIKSCDILHIFGDNKKLISFIENIHKGGVYYFGGTGVKTNFKITLK